MKYNNIGEEILALLREKADAEWGYYNPNFLLALTETVDDYYGIRDDKVDEWVSDMFGA